MTIILLEQQSLLQKPNKAPYSDLNSKLVNYTKVG